PQVSVKTSVESRPSQSEKIFCQQNLDTKADGSLVRSANETVIQYFYQDGLFTVPISNVNIDYYIYASVSMVGTDVTPLRYVVWLLSRDAGRVEWMAK
ncbi:hypothetical protein LOC54_09475, partial [Acetobacter sp. AN02]|uniref:hypothetical protein n=1 Tax=Acetobacter sp. AN02 TaxID=2894186 RepID=UPI0024345244